MDAEQGGGDVSFVLELVACGEGARDIYCGKSARVRSSDIKSVVIDEGHNNRCSGYMDAFARLLGEADYNPRINEGRIDAQTLDGADILVINVPETGFSLTPTFFLMMKSSMQFPVLLRRAGSLLLAGGSDFPPACAVVISLICCWRKWDRPSDSTGTR